MKAIRRATLALSLAGAAAAVHPATGAEPVLVQANLFRFCEASATACNPSESAELTVVGLGRAVEWIYNDPGCDAVVICPGHNVVFDDGVGGETKKGNTLDPLYPNRPVLLTRVFDKVGTFPYKCTIHVPFGMTGIVQVVQLPPPTG
jgi:plastocyanin